LWGLKLWTALSGISAGFQYAAFSDWLIAKLHLCFDSSLSLSLKPNLCAAFSILLWSKLCFDCSLFTPLNLSPVVSQIVLCLSLSYNIESLCAASSVSDHSLFYTIESLWNLVCSLSLSPNLCAEFSALLQTLATANGSKFGTISSTFCHSLQHPFLLPSSLLCVGFSFMITNWLLHLSPFFFKNP